MRGLPQIVLGARRSGAEPLDPLQQHDRSLERHPELAVDLGGRAEAPIGVLDPPVGRVEVRAHALSRRSRRGCEQARRDRFDEGEELGQGRGMAELERGLACHAETVPHGAVSKAQGVPRVEREATALERRLQLMPGEQAVGVARRGAGEELDVRLGT